MNHRLLFVICLFLSSISFGQRQRNAIEPFSADQILEVKAQRSKALDSSWTSGLELRSVGPTVMSGRVADMAIVDPTGQTFYVAYASGGLWKTQNHGTSFEPLFDEALTITLGAIAVHPASGRIWAGTGEVNSSRSSYAGSGIYISDDDGKTWRHAGLADGHHVGRIVLDAKNPDLAYAAVLGPLYSTNRVGGVYRTVDGGNHWDRLLYAEGDHGDAGAVELVADPTDPLHLFAALWDRTRSAWNFQGNGNGSGIWETEDGGESWVELSLLDGFPDSEYTGRIGLAWHPEDGILYALLDNQSPVTSDSEAEETYSAQDFKEMSKEAFAALDTARLEGFLDQNDFPANTTAALAFEQVTIGELVPKDFYDYLTDGNQALFEAPIAGAEVYRLNLNNRKSWERTHENELEDVWYTYGYYFGLIEVDPLNSDHLFIAGVPLIESVDGGSTWKSLNTANVHADHHHLWINPKHPEHLINGNDGGINISWDGGENWINCNSPEVGQFYAIEVDNAEPYNIYGGLQDNGTWRGPSTYRKSPRWHQSGHYPWEAIGGGDGMQIEVDPRNPEVIFSGSQFGWYSRQELNSDEYMSLHPRHSLGEKPYRWNWQTPIWLSRHQPDILYMASNHVHRSFDQGQNWETLSRDLTRGGRPGNVPFGTITSLHESPMRFGQMAIGTDDGLIQVSRDGGNSWKELTSPLVQAPQKDQTLWISEVLWSSHHKDRLYVALNGYRLDHFESYVFKTENDGRTWERLGDRTRGNGLPAEPVNAIAESEDFENLLFVGTDGGCYSSIDGGKNWGVLHSDLPNVPVHDLVIQERENELVIGTHGRSIWVANLNPLIEHFGEAPLSWSTPDTLLLAWRENWGERGWAWSDPWEVTVAFDLYSDQTLQGSWHWVDTDGNTLAELETSTIYRGWQTVEVSAQWVKDETVQFLEKGVYQLQWVTGDGTPTLRPLAGPAVKVEEVTDFD
ncbi:MAG: glycosyl hydrolase [Bacteroidetes bacterium]|nr:glycosyl hydrolase [Bacteroidota bacterium]